MFEARLLQGSLLKKIIEALRELVTDANLECNEGGISMQVTYFKTYFTIPSRRNNEYHIVYRQWTHPTFLFVPYNSRPKDLTTFDAISQLF